MRREEFLTDEQVEEEIERLKSSEAVKLARKEQAYKYRRRQVLYQLRYMEKRGNELMKLGYTADSFRFNADEMEDADEES